jgi:hypothetical protein
VCPKSKGERPNLLGLFFLREIQEAAAMAKRQRVFQGGKEYVVTGPTKKSRRLVFVVSVKVEGKELLLFRPVRKVKKHRN